MYTEGQIVEARVAWREAVDESPIGQIYDTPSATWGPLITIVSSLGSGALDSHFPARFMFGDAHYYVRMNASGTGAVIGYKSGGIFPSYVQLEVLEQQVQQTSSSYVYFDVAKVLDVSKNVIYTNLPAHGTPIENQVRVRRGTNLRQVGWIHPTTPGQPPSVSVPLCSVNSPKLTWGAFNTWLNNNRPSALGGTVILTLRTLNVIMPTPPGYQRTRTQLITMHIGIHTTISSTSSSPAPAVRVRTMSNAFGTSYALTDRVYCGGSVREAIWLETGVAISRSSSVDGALASYNTNPFTHAVHASADSVALRADIDVLLNIDSEGGLSGMTVNITDPTANAALLESEIISARYRGDGWI